MTKLIVDQKQREAKKRAHTSAHLLHLKLNELLGETKQAGSMVDEDYVRFDFTAQQPLDEQTISEIENGINQIIKDSLKVEKKEMSFEEAIEEGAKAFFEEKYGERVRVVKIGNEKAISMELCGGTHLDNTKEMGIFKIIDQQAVASGIRRLTAYTGPKVTEYIREKDDFLREISNKLESNEKQLIPKIDKLLNEYHELKEKYHSLENKLIKTSLIEEKGKQNQIFENIINVSENEELNGVDFKTISGKAKKILEGQNSLLYTNEGNFCLIMSKGNISAKDIIKEYELKGGGGEDFGQGKDPNVTKLIK